MKKFLFLAPVLALAACGDGKPLVQDGHLKAELEKQGYSKVLIQAKRLDCGRFGKGKTFIATKKPNVVVGQICYLKKNGNISYDVTVLETHSK